MEFWIRINEAEVVLYGWEPDLEKKHYFKEEDLFENCWVSFQDAESLYFVLTYAKCGDFFTFLKKTIKKVCYSQILFCKIHLIYVCCSLQHFWSCFVCIWFAFFPMKKFVINFVDAGLSFGSNTIFISPFPKMIFPSLLRYIAFRLLCALFEFI